MGWRREWDGRQNRRMEEGFEESLEYSCTNSTNQIAHCEVSKSHSETSYGVSLLSSQGTVPVKVIVYCQLEIHGN